jgi:hypothetical protein
MLKLRNSCHHSNGISLFAIGEERRSQGAKRRKLENERRKVEREQYDNGPTFGDNTAVPVFAPSEGMSNHDVVANRASLRMANQSAAAALKAEIMGTAQDGETADEPGPHGTKRKADELDEAEAEADQEDANDESDEPDNEAAGRAILARVAAEKKAKDDAAQAREPDDEVRYV